MPTARASTTTSQINLTVHTAVLELRDKESLVCLSMTMLLRFSPELRWMGVPSRFKDNSCH